MAYSETTRHRSLHSLGSRILMPLTATHEHQPSLRFLDRLPPLTPFTPLTPNSALVEGLEKGFVRTMSRVNTIRHKNDPLNSIRPLENDAQKANTPTVPAFNASVFKKGAKVMRLPFLNMEPTEAPPPPLTFDSSTTRKRGEVKVFNENCQLEPGREQVVPFEANQTRELMIMFDPAQGVQLMVRKLTRNRIPSPEIRAKSARADADAAVRRVRAKRD